MTNRRFSRIVDGLLIAGCVAAVATLVFGGDPYTRVAAQPALQTPAVSCNLSVPVSMSSATTTQMIALAANQRVHICGFVFQSAAATTAKIVTGTGTNCAGNQADQTGVFTFTTTPSSVPYGNGSGTVIRGPIGHAVCVTNSGGVQLSGVITYTQF